MGIFSKIKDEMPEGVRGQFIKEGYHKLKLKRCYRLDSRKKVTYVVAEFEVLESEVHRVGETLTYMVGDDLDNFLRNCKTLFCAIVASYTGIATEEVASESVDEAIAEGIIAEPGTAYAGTVLTCTAKDVVTKQGKPFTKRIFESPF